MYMGPLNRNFIQFKINIKMIHDSKEKNSNLSILEKVKGQKP